MAWYARSTTICTIILLSCAYQPAQLAAIKSSIEPSTSMKDFSVNGSKPLLLYNRISIISMSAISLMNSEFELDFFLFQRWLVNSSVCATYHAMQEIEAARALLVAIDGALTITDQNILSQVWLPSTYFTEVKTTLNLQSSLTSGFIQIYDYNDTCVIKFTRRLFTSIGCKMDFREYPNDVQNCSLTFTSYFWSDGVLKYLWDKEPLEFDHENMDQNHYEIDISSSLERSVAFDGKDRTWLVVRLIFRRKITHFIYQAVIPSILIVTSSYFSFYISVESGPGRFLFTALPFFALITLYSGVKGQLPPVSYVNASDIWMLATLCFDFSTICVMTYCVYLSKLDKTRARASSIAKQKSVGRLESSDGLESPPWKRKPVGTGKRKKQSLNKKKTVMRHFSFILYTPEKDKTIYSRADYIDSIMKVLFPILFFTFNCVYWILVFSRRLLS